MNVVVVTPPAEPLIDLAVVKAHLRVEHDDHDGLIEDLIAGCAAWLDGPSGILGRAVGVQTLRADYAEGFSGRRGWTLPLGPVREIKTIGYRDPLGQDQTVSDNVFDLVPKTNRVRLLDGQSWPASAGPVSITYEAGYGLDDLPANIRSAMLLHMKILYDAPEEKALAAMERSRDALLNPLRIRRV